MLTTKKKLQAIRIALFCFFASSVWLAVSCNDQPTELGLSLIPDTVSTDVITTNEAQLIIEAEPMLVRFPFVHQGFIALGKSRDFKSTALIRFVNFPDSLHYLQNLNEIDSVLLIMKPLRYVLGDSLGAAPLSFKVHKINKLWKVGYTWDSLLAEGGEAAFFDPAPIASFKGKIDIMDTLPNFKVELGKEFLRQWLDTNFKEINYGLALIPDDDCAVVHKFSGSRINENFPVPYVKIFFKDKSGKDTFAIAESAYEGTFPQCQVPENSVFIQGLMVYRLLFKFDLSAIPKMSGINKANFEVYIDRGKSYWGNYGIDKAVKAGIYQNIYELNPLYDPYGYPYEYTGIYDSTTQNRYVFQQITSAVEHIVRSGGKGNFVITPFESGGDLFQADRIALYGINAIEPAMRPKMRIFYSNLEKK